MSDILSTFGTRLKEICTKVDSVFSRNRKLSMTENMQKGSWNDYSLEIICNLRMEKSTRL